MSDEIKNIENILREVSEKIQIENDKKQQTAEDFNIFEILGVAHLEVSTHSAFIANLLNPKGSHSQGAKFLEKFLKLIKVEDFNLSSAQVEVEKYIGNLGQIDIFITDNAKWAIAIENKIYAGLGEEQLGRYMRFLNDSKMPNNKKLVYLTLQNNNTKDEDNNLYRIQGVKEEDFGKCKHISYETEITKWLNPFLHFNAFLPINLAFGISQYICIINRLISKDKEMAEWDKIIKTKEAYKAYKKIAYSDYRKEKVQEIFGNILGELQNKLNEKYENKYSCGLTEKFNRGCSEEGIKIKLADNAFIGAFFQGSDYWNLYLGINDSDNKKYKDDLENIGGGGWKEENNWKAWKYFSADKDEDVVETLCFDEGSKKRITDLINTILDLVKVWDE